MRQSIAFIDAGVRRRSALLGLAVLLGLGALANATVARADFVPPHLCTPHDYITSEATPDGIGYVSAELGYTGARYGELRARASQPGPWENYSICYDVQFDGSKLWSFQNMANGRWVSAELNDTGGYYGMLRARATAVGPWERFKIFRAYGVGFYYIQSAASNRYVSTELAYTGSNQYMLRARATAIGPWEHFSIICSGIRTVCPP